MKERLATILALTGVLFLVGLNVWESGYAVGYKTGASEQPPPRIIYRRGEYSTEELRRILKQRARAT